MNLNVIGWALLAGAAYFFLRGEVQTILDQAAVKAGAAAGANAGRNVGDSLTKGIGTIARSFVDGGAGEP